MYQREARSRRSQLVAYLFDILRIGDIRKMRSGKSWMPRSSTWRGRKMMGQEHGSQTESQYEPVSIVNVAGIDISNFVTQMLRSGCQSADDKRDLSRQQFRVIQTSLVTNANCLRPARQRPIQRSCLYVLSQPSQATRFIERLGSGQCKGDQGRLLE